MSKFGLLHFNSNLIKEGNGLNCFLIQKKMLQVIQATGHKNYSCSMVAFKNTILKHPNPQYSHRYMWNVFAGRKGRSLKFPLDQKNEHLNRYLKDAFKSLGVNLDEKNAKRVNNSADIGIKIETQVRDFFKVDAAGLSHTKKNRQAQRNKLSKLMKKEDIAAVYTGLVFNGPQISSNLWCMFDEVKYRAWHLSKENELLKFEKFKEIYFTSV